MMKITQWANLERGIEEEELIYLSITFAVLFLQGSIVSCRAAFYIGPAGLEN